MLTTEQKLLSGAAHLGTFVALPVLIPLVVMLLSNDEFVKTQAKEALAFQLTMIGLGVIGGILSIILIGIPILILVAIMTVVFPIIATIKVADSIDYTYPISGSFVRKNF